MKNKDYCKLVDREREDARKRHAKLLQLNEELKAKRQLEERKVVD